MFGALGCVALVVGLRSKIKYKIKYKEVYNILVGKTHTHTHEAEHLHLLDFVVLCLNSV